MSKFFGPLDAEGRVPPRQQTRAVAFLISAHGALARQFAFALPAKLDAAWQTELNAQLYRESEIVSLLLRATSWMPDFALAYMAASTTSVFNVSGHPALTQCMGFDANGMPLSIQVVGKYFDEATMLRVAATYEAATPWRDRRPTVLAPGTTRETVP